MTPGSATQTEGLTISGSTIPGATREWTLVSSTTWRSPVGMGIGGLAIPASGGGNIQAEDVKGGEAGVSKSFRYTIVIISHHWPHVSSYFRINNIVAPIQDPFLAETFSVVQQFLCFFVSFPIRKGGGEGSKPYLNSKIKRIAADIANKWFFGFRFRAVFVT
jgi:hypothetical protein